MTVGTNPKLSQLEDADVTSIGSFPIKAKIHNLDVVTLEDGELNSVISFGLTM